MAALKPQRDQPKNSPRAEYRIRRRFPASHWRSRGVDRPPLRRFLSVLRHTPALLDARSRNIQHELIYWFHALCGVYLLVSVSESPWKIVGPRIFHHAMDDCGDFFHASGHAVFGSGLHQLS